MKYDLQVENLRRFFDSKMLSITYDQKQKLSPQVLARIFSVRGSLLSKPLTFMEQVYVLTQTGISNVFVVIEDLENGIGLADFEKHKKKQLAGKTDLSEAEYYLAKGCMVLSGQDVADWVNHLNALSHSGNTNYALKMKGTEAKKVVNAEDDFIYFCNMLSNYECNKKKIFRKEDFEAADLYILFFLGDGTDRNGAFMYNKKFLDCVNASRTQVLRSFRKLIRLGYIKKSGKARQTTYQITFLGRSAIGNIMKNYIFA